MAKVEVNGFSVFVSEIDFPGAGFSAVLDDYFDGAPDTKYGLATMTGTGATAQEAIDDLMEMVEEYEAEQEMDEPDDSSADAEWLASAGMGTDEDYGYYGGDDGY